MPRPDPFEPRPAAIQTPAGCYCIFLLGAFLRRKEPKLWLP